MEKNQELEGEMLNKGLEEGKELLHNQSNTKTLAAELEEMSDKEVTHLLSCAKEINKCLEL